MFKNVMLNHDMSKEERVECRKWITKKKNEILLKEDAEEWGIKGQPGKFYMVAYQKKKFFVDPCGSEEKVKRDI